MAAAAAAAFPSDSFDCSRINIYAIPMPSTYKTLRMERLGGVGTGCKNTICGVIRATYSIFRAHKSAERRNDGKQTARTHTQKTHLLHPTVVLRRVSLRLLCRVGVFVGLGGVAAATVLCVSITIAAVRLEFKSSSIAHRR